MAAKLHWVETHELEWDIAEDGDDTEFFEYRGARYDVRDFCAVNNRFWNPNPPAWQKGWDGYLTDTFFSAVLIKYVDDGEAVKVATYF